MRAQQLLLGEWPVRDFVDPGFIGMYVVSAIGHLVDPAVFRVEVIIAAAGFATAAALSFRLARLLTGTWWIAAISTLVQVALYPRLYSYPKLLVTAVALTAGWAACRSLPRLRLWPLVAATAIGYYFRHDLGVYVAISCLTLIAVACRMASETMTKPLALYAGACALAVAPHLAYVQWAIGVPAYLQTALRYSQEEARRGNVVGTYQPRGNVRWAPGVDDRTRAQLERKYRLTNPEFREGRTWRYSPQDRSVANVHALLADPHVEDTHDLTPVAFSTRVWQAAVATVKPARQWRAPRTRCSGCSGAAPSRSWRRPGSSPAIIRPCALRRPGPRC